MLTGLALLFVGCGGETDPCDEMVCVEELPAAFAGLSLQPTPHGFSAYGCAPTEAFLGEETVYQVTLESEGFLSAKITGDASSGLIVLLGSLDAGDCIDSHSSAVGANLLPGAYYIAVDTAEEVEHNFSIQIAQTTEATLQEAGLSPQLASDALTTFSNAWAWGATRRTEYTIVDFSLHSADKRQWTFDMSTNEVLWNLRVAHGLRSTDGEDLATAKTFSNLSGSNQSSLGLLRTAGTYVGTFGASFRLEGLEPGFNDKVCDRDIVMHPWAPIGDAYVDRCGFARPSLGCPAIDSLLSAPVRNRLARPDDVGLEFGALMLFWHPSTSWFTDSVYLRGTEPTTELTEQLAVECDSSWNGTPTPPEASDYSCD